MTDYLSEQDKALCEALLADPPRDITGLAGAPGWASAGHAWLAGNLSVLGPRVVARIHELSAQLAEHPNATDWQNRAERAEQEAAELRERLELTGDFADGPDGIECRDDTIKLLDHRLAAAQRKIDALQQRAEALAAALEIEAGSNHGGNWHAYEALANWTAWLIDGKD